ncbi:MAG: outer membrane lipoprotein-sorting protein [Bacteroidetes bacterium]|nr:outer membrane lipoprotein-sorting protein [Bacteroidota bacterium]
MIQIKQVFALFLLSTSIILIPCTVQSQDAKALLKKMDDLMMAPKDRIATVEILLENKGGKEKAREAEMKQKGADKRLYRYTKPENQAGIATLSLPGGEMWLYLPAFGKPKKISLLAKSQAFTGTDFSYEDMDPKPYSERFDPKLINSTDKIWQLELTPSYEKSDYSKIVVDLDKTNYFPTKMEYFDNGGQKVKVADYNYIYSGKYWYAKTVTMKDLKKEHSTEITMKEVKFDQGLSDDDFTVESMIPADKRKTDK